MWSRFPLKPTGSKLNGTVIWTPHAQYYVDDIIPRSSESSWVRRVFLPAMFKAALTLVALAVLLVLIAMIAAERPVAKARDCLQGGCPSGQGWTPF